MEERFSWPDPAPKAPLTSDALKHSIGCRHPDVRVCPQVPSLFARVPACTAPRTLQRKLSWGHRARFPGGPCIPAVRAPRNDTRAWRCDAAHPPPRPRSPEPPAGAVHAAGRERVRGRVGASAAVPRCAEAAAGRAQQPSGSLAGPGRSADFAPRSEEARRGSDSGDCTRERGPGGFWRVGLEGSENLV